MGEYINTLLIFGAALIAIFAPLHYYHDWITKAGGWDKYWKRLFKPEVEGDKFHFIIVIMVIGLMLFFLLSWLYLIWIIEDYASNFY